MWSIVIANDKRTRPRGNERKSGVKSGCPDRTASICTRDVRGGRRDYCAPCFSVIFFCQLLLARRKPASRECTSAESLRVSLNDNRARIEIESRSSWESRADLFINLARALQLCESFNNRDADRPALITKAHARTCLLCTREAWERLLPHAIPFFLLAPAVLFHPAISRVRVADADPGRETRFLSWQRVIAPDCSNNSEYAADLSLSFSLFPIRAHFLFLSLAARTISVRVSRTAFSSDTI